jgi:hypothetical protein
MGQDSDSEIIKHKTGMPAYTKRLSVLMPGKRKIYYDVHAAE